MDLAGVEVLLGEHHVLSAQLPHGHQALHVAIETHDAAKLLDADDEAVRDAAHAGVRVCGKHRQRGIHHPLLSRQIQLPGRTIH